MEREELEKIFEDTESKWDGDNAFQGLIIIRKYFPDKDIICGADHDIIYSVDVDDMLEAGLSEKDAIALRKLNWMLHDGDCLACFV